MASGLNQTQLRFMVGEVPRVKNSDGYSVDVLRFVHVNVYFLFQLHK